MLLEKKDQSCDFMNTLLLEVILKIKSLNLYLHLISTWVPRREVVNLPNKSFVNE